MKGTIKTLGLYLYIKETLHKNNCILKGLYTKEILYKEIMYYDSLNYILLNIAK